MNTSSSKKQQIGLIFGKFYPLHCGHVYLIEKAVSQVDELHVILGCEHERDLKLYHSSKMPRQPQVEDRLYWLQKTFQNRHNIHIHLLDEQGITYYPDGWKAWSDRVKSLLDEFNIKPTVILTSEPQDIENHERYYHCPAKLIDADRQFINISATKVRQNPYQNWHFIAKHARPFFVKKVAIIGDDSNTIPQQLANIYNTEYIPNGYINYIHYQNVNNILPTLNEQDYERIAKLHAKRVENALSQANRLIFSSLDFKTLHHLYHHAFLQHNKILFDLEERYHFDLVIDMTSFKSDQLGSTIIDMMITQIEKLLA